jgi:Flp pilus assembly protein TadG
MFLVRGTRRNEGQSLLETALTIPLLLALAFNLINFAYFWFMVLTLAAAPRAGVQYSVQGGTVSSSSSTPSTSAVTTVVTDNITNAVSGATTSNVAVRVCSATASGGVNSTTGIANCDKNTAGSSFGFPAVDATCCADPEEPAFVLNRVDVGYTVTPIIPGTAFGLFLPSNLVFQRHASMRSLF